MVKIEVNEGKLPWVVGIGTILSGILFGVVSFLYPGGSAVVTVLSYLFLVLIICSGAGLCLNGRNRKLKVEDGKLCYSDWLGRKKPFLLEEIGYCKAALERGNKDYLKLYNLLGEKLCKLEFNMHGSIPFLQYLLDNQVKVECSEKSDIYLKYMLQTAAVCREEIPSAVNAAYQAAQKQAGEWVKKHKSFCVEWKMGIAVYLEEELSEEKQLWEQKGYAGALSDKLPEGYLVVIEGYLQKEGEFVLDKKNQAVVFHIPVVCVSKSMQIGEALRIRFFKSALEELEGQLALLSEVLPRRRYHTEPLVLNHELKELLDS